MVVTDGSAVYSKPDFDSPVQDYLGYQTVVVVSKKPYMGSGGMGLFHRIKYAGKTGFIADTDVRVSRKETERLSKDEKRKNPSKAFDEEESFRGKGPVYLTRFVGGALSMVHFTERFSGRKLGSDMLLYGLRMTGPGTLFDGPPLDFNFLFSLQKPGYYSKFAGSPSGFMLFGDVMAMFPLVNGDKFLLSYGMGLMWVYTRYTVPVREAITGELANFDSQEFRMGADFSLGAARRFGRYQLRGDIKYYVEKTSYPGYTLSFQMEY